MSELDQLIKENRNLFDFKEPEKDHEKRFKYKLNMSDHLKYRNLWRIAALVVSGLFIFTSAFLYVLKIENDPNKIISELDPELRKAVYYYDVRNSEMMATIESMEFTSTKTKNDIFEDIKSYDNSYNNILSDLRKYPNNERVINAFIEHYRSKTELLGFIIAQLNETNQTIKNN